MEDIGGTILGGDWEMMIFKLLINVLFCGILVRLLYYPGARNKNFSFSYVMISVVVFFLCFALRKLELDMGMALGMFAIFAIIRYRTDPIPVKEMTYLFMVIGIAVINGLANENMALGEIIFANVCITVAAALLEKLWIKKRLATKLIIYENIQNIVPDRKQELIDDIQVRTGLDVQRIEIGDVDFLKDTAMITVFYNPV